MTEPGPAPPAKVAGLPPATETPSPAGPSQTPESPTVPSQVLEAAAIPSLWALFSGFVQVGLSGFGGVLPFARRMLVDQRRWLSGAEFNALLGLCHFLPGPNVVNLSVCLGARFHGAAGAWAATLGLILPPFVVAMGLAIAYGQWGQLPLAQNMLRGVAAVGAGLLFATALKMARNVAERWIYLPFSALILIAVAVLRWPLPPLMLALLAITSTLAWVRARRRRS